MDTATIDQEFEKLQGEFGDVATTVQALAQKLQAAEQAGDKNATEWLGDLKQVAQDIDDRAPRRRSCCLLFTRSSPVSHRARRSRRRNRRPHRGPG